MLRPTNSRIYSNEFKCYLWALLNPTQLPSFDFYPRIWKSSKAHRLNFNFGIIQGSIYIYSLNVEFFIPDEVWIAYLTAYDIPENKQQYYYSQFPF